MENVILNDIKEMLGIAVNYDVQTLDHYSPFDLDVVICINNAFSRLNQLGIGPNNIFRIITGKETWDDFWGDKPNDSIKSYIYLKTKILFDPPQSSFVLESFNKQIAELEWCLNVTYEQKEKE